MEIDIVQIKTQLKLKMAKDLGEFLEYPWNDSVELDLVYPIDVVEHLKLLGFKETAHYSHTDNVIFMDGDTVSLSIVMDNYIGRLKVDCDHSNPDNDEDYNEEYEEEYEEESNLDYKGVEKI